MGYNAVTLLYIATAALWELCLQAVIIITLSRVCLPLVAVILEELIDAIPAEGLFTPSDEPASKYITPDFLSFLAVKCSLMSTSLGQKLNHTQLRRFYILLLQQVKAGKAFNRFILLQEGSSRQNSFQPGVLSKASKVQEAAFVEKRKRLCRKTLLFWARGGPGSMLISAVHLFHVPPCSRQTWSGSHRLSQRLVYPCCLIVRISLIDFLP